MVVISSPLMHHGKAHAAEHAAAVDVHRAGATLAVVATLFGAGQIEVLAQGVQQSDPGLDGQLAIPAIDLERERHGTGCGGGGW